MEEKTNNLVAKHARKYNKAAVHKDRKKAMKKGDRKHKGRYEEIENVDEVSTTVGISNFLKKTANRKKYDKAVSDIKSGKYKIGKAAQVYNLDPKTLQSMMEKLSPSDGAGEYVKDFRKSDAPQFKGKSDKKKQQMAIAAYLDAKDKNKKESMEEWNHSTTEKTRRVKGGDKRKKYMKEKQVEEKKGLWDRIHAKRKRGEKPAKPGEKGYPKTLDIESVQEGKNTPGDGNPCWDTHKKVGTKMKNGKRVNDCVPKNEGKFDVKKNMVRKNDADEFIKQGGKALHQNRKDTMAALKDLQNRKKMREGLDEYSQYFKPKGGSPSKLPAGSKKEALSVQQRSVIGKASDAKRREKTSTQNTVKKAAQRAQVDKRISEGRSAQDRLNARSAKHGLGQPNKAADDYLSKMMKKYGAKDMADLKKKMGMKEDSFDYKYEPELRDRLEELTQREIDMMNQRKQANLVKRGKAKPQPKGAGRVGNTGRRGGEGGEDDSSLVMQLRKAQDLRGNYEIKFKGGKTKLPKQLIDKLLNTYNKLNTPADKKKFETLLTHELRKKEGIATQKSKTAADKAMDKFNKTKGKGLPAPRGKKGGPSDSELRNIERGK